MNEREELNFISYLKGFQVLKSREDYQGKVGNHGVVHICCLRKKQEDTISQLEGTVKLKAMKPKSFLESSRSNRLSK